jgi:murein DD-endopeptidase MepM/ murein hydrolase activator NlpD
MIEFVKWTLAVIIAIIIVVLLLIGLSYLRLRDRGIIQYAQYKQNSDSVELPIAAGLEQCAAAPFIIPTGGWIGILYGDTILGARNHSGLDIFGLEGNGVTPVYAAYDGYVTRLPEWTSAVIIRHPDDPLQPGRQIWTYYTHMADAAGNSYIIDQIPPGAVELPVKQGTLLGYQGDYNGASLRSIDTHLHFSIVRDNGSGQFLNETDIANTLDPSPYLGMRLNSNCADRPPVCRPDFFCP